MAVTNYVSLGGLLYSEIDSAGRLDYMTDALGSVTGTVASTASVQNTYRYLPFGSMYEQSGSGPTPKFLWVGTLGYRATGLSQSETYVRARHYGQLYGSWGTVDALWPKEFPYAYVNGRVVTSVDQSGKSTLPNGYSVGWYTIDLGNSGRTGADDCGFAGWQIGWNVIAPVDDSSGYVIQHVQGRRHCAPCGGGKCSGINSSVSANFYEAFEVRFVPTQGTNADQDGNQDYWNLGGNLPCSRGFVGIFSYMRYYPGLTTDNLSALGFRQGGCPLSGSNQWCTPYAPSGWRDRTPMRSMNYTWNCCGHPPKCPQKCTVLPGSFDYSPKDYP